MSQYSTTVAAGSGAVVRAAINNALNTLETNHSGPSAPGTTYAYMIWADTTANLLKMRNAANNAWITLGVLDVDRLGLAQASSVQFGSYLYGASSTGNDSYAVTLAPAPASLANGLAVELWPDVGNTGAATLNANGFGAKAIKKNLAGSIVDIATGDIVANYPALMRYVASSQYYLLINPTTPATPTVIAYLVGDILMTATYYANSAAVAAAYGYGTWAVFGSGRMPVGVDTGQTEFNTIEKTGGAKTKSISHTHTQGSHQHKLDGSRGGGSGTSLVMEMEGSGDVAQTGYTYPGGEATGSGGSAAQDVLNPYITVYMWKRTA
jgi:hypothetical protein